MNKNLSVFFFLIVFATLFTSCSSVRKHYSVESYFASENLDVLNGRYVMDRKNLYEFFNVKAADYEVRYTNKYYGVDVMKGSILEPVSPDEILQDSTKLDFIILDFNGKDTLNIIYRDNSFWYKTSYHGKLKEKYFEIYLQKKRYPFFPIFSRFDIDRIRLGINNSGKVIIHNYSEHWGTLLLFGAHSGGDEYAFSLERIE